MTPAFLLLGFLVGNLIGLSAQSAVVPFLGLVFALAGGSLVAFIEKLAGDDRRNAARALGAFSAACIVGLYGAIVVSEWQLLSPKASADGQAAKETTRPKVEERKYLRASHVSAMREIDQQYFAGHLKAEEAYTRLQKVCDGTEE